MLFFSIEIDHNIVPLKSNQILEKSLNDDGNFFQKYHVFNQGVSKALCV